MAHADGRMTLAVRRSAVAGISVTLLCFASGVTDVLSYLTLGRIFTSAMTGCVALFAIALILGKRGAAIRAGISLGSYVVGGALAVVLQQRSTAQVRNPVTLRRLLAAEIIILAAYCLVAAHGAQPPAGARRFVLIGLSAFAMGIQAVVARDVHERGISTVVLNVTMTGAVVALTRALLRRDRRLSSHTLLQLTVIGGYAIGAAGAAFGLTRGVHAVDVLPLIAALASFGLQFLLHPMPPPRLP